MDGSLCGPAPEPDPCDTDGDCAPGEHCDLSTCDVDPATGLPGGGVCVPTMGCAPVLCDLYCEHGFDTDAAGCLVCSCAPPPPPPRCEPIFCPIDCELALDDRGCEICECASGPR